MTDFIMDLNELVKVGIVIPLWNAIYYLVEIWVFKFPKILGGFESSDPYQLCANMLGRPYPEINNAVWMNTCIPLFREKLTAYAYLVAVVLVCIWIRVIWSIIYDVMVKNPSIAKLQADFMSQAFKSFQFPIHSARRIDTAEQRANRNSKEKETKFINAECYRFINSVCDELSSSSNAEVQLNRIRSFLDNMDAVVGKKVNHPMLRERLNRLISKNFIDDMKQE